MFINNWIDTINQSILKAIQDSVSYLAKLVLDLMGRAVYVLDYPMVQSGIKYFQGIAITFLAVKVAVEAYKNYIMYDNGDPNADPKGLILKAFYSVAVIETIPWIVRAMFELGHSMASDVSNLEGAFNFDVNIPGTGAEMSSLILSGGVSILLVIISLLAGLIFMGIIYLQTFVRAGELALLAVIGPAISLNIASQNTSMFKMWFQELIRVCISQTLQIFLLKVAFYSLNHFGSIGTEFESLLMFIAWLWLTYKTPSFINQFKYSSGGSSAIGGIGQQILTSKITSKMR